MLRGKVKHGAKGSGKSTKETPKSTTMPSSSKSREFDAVSVEIPEPREKSPANPPILRTADNARVLPRYSAVLARSKEEGVNIEDLAILQLELESLLVSAAVRHRSLLDDIVQLKSAEEKRDRKNKFSSPKNLSTPSSLAKRGSTRGEERSAKRLKESVKAKAPSGSGKLGRNKDLSSRDSPKPEPSKIVIPKNDTPNKFWASVEPYCAPVTAEDLSYLAEQIRIREEERNSELYTIPPLGKHYSQLWAEEDLGEDAAKSVQLGGTTGPLTQRLVSALMEEKLVPKLEQERTSRDLSGPRAAAIRQVQSHSFEKRVREELREQGILDGDEAPKEQADDELLLEIKRVQSELKALSAHNLMRLRHLYQLGETQMKRQELVKKMNNIDTELMTIHATKQKNKNLGEKEKEHAWRLLREREAILKQLHPTSAT